MSAIVGHGIDVVELSEFERLLSVPGDHLLTRCFTNAEVAYAGNGPHRVQRLAARFAAKEACRAGRLHGKRGGDDIRVGGNTVTVVNGTIDLPE